MPRTEAELAREALYIQDSCNLSGVVNTFKGVLHDLWTIARTRGEGTEWVNRHPVSVLFSDKILSLSHAGSIMRFDKSYEYCKKLVKGLTTMEIVEESLNEHENMEKKEPVHG